MLKWEDFLAAVQRCGPWSGELKQLQYDAGGLCGEAKKVFWPELKALLLGGKAGDAAGGLGMYAIVLGLIDCNKYVICCSIRLLMSSCVLHVKSTRSADEEKLFISAQRPIHIELSSENSSPRA